MKEPTQAPWLTERYIPQTCLGRKAGRQTWLAIDQVTGDSVVVKRLAFESHFLRQFQFPENTPESLKYSL
jgi:hypothetical protein